LDHLVGKLLEVERYVEAKHLSSRWIDDEVELRGLLDREVARPLALENAGSVDADPAIVIGNAGAVAHQKTARSELAKEENGGYRMADRQGGVLIAPAYEERIRTDDERARPESEQGRKGRINVVFGACLDDMDLQSECAAGCLRFLCGGLGKSGIGGVDER